jgi:hypothetical protein
MGAESMVRRSPRGSDEVCPSLQRLVPTYAARGLMLSLHRTQTRPPTHSLYHKQPRLLVPVSQSSLGKHVLLRHTE